MVYYDIHTHKQTIRHDEVAIVSIDIRQPFELYHAISDRDYPVANTGIQQNRPEIAIKSNPFYSVGVHPWYIDSTDPETINRLFTKASQLALLPEVVAIGETGLDKNTVKSSDDYFLQQELFISHARLSEEVKKPLIIHCVKAWNDLLHIRQSIQPAMPWIIHGFRGKRMLATQLLNSVFYLSFAIHYNIDSLKTAWTRRRLLLETDDKDIDISNLYQQAASDLDVSKQELAQAIEKILHSPFSILH
jgi:TatD DNase family protein